MVRSGQARSKSSQGQIRTGQVKSAQFRSIKFSPDKVRVGYGQLNISSKSCKVMPGQVGSSQAC